MRTYALTFVAVMITATVASAQPTHEQARATAERSIVTVELRDGTWKGRLLEIDAEAVTIEPPHDPPIRLALDDVLSVKAKKKDPIGNGALIGAAVGVLYCVVLCRNGAWMLMEGSAGMVIGAVVDAHIDTPVVLYKRQVNAPPKRSPGLFFTVRF
ncbi:MAG TPA: hypothetical protein VF147_17380 [Vicinamibacterales bacterium]